MRLHSKLAGPLALAALIAAVAVGGSAQASTSSGVQATATEFRIQLSRPSIKPGKLRLEFVNFGEDDHDLAILRKSTGSVTKLAVIHPGERDVVNVPARKGSYVLWCTLSDHKSRGMRAVLRVKK